MKRIFQPTTIVLAAALAACSPATRSIDSPGFDRPEVFGVEKEIREGTITLPSTGETALKKRVAVVIGNSAYASVTPLDNPRNDANDMADLLRQNGFQVVQGLDIGKRSFELLLRNAVRAGGPGAEVVAFYAGHGFQIGSYNYLVPVDAKLANANDLPFQTVRLDSLLKILGTRSDRHVSFLDSCRNNPFPNAEAKTGASRGTGSTAIGFSEPFVPRGSFVVYSTKPGAVAYDGEGTPNSPFTGALLTNIRNRPGADLHSTLESVRSSVLSATGGKQTPTWTSRIEGSFAFADNPKSPAKITPKAAAAGTKTAALTPPPAEARPPASPDTAPLPGDRPTVTIDAPMEKVVAAGGRIADKLNLPPTATVSVVRPPEKGSVARIDADAKLGDPMPQNVTAADAGAVVYVAPPDQVATTGSPASDTVTDTIVVEVKIPEAPSKMINVELRLTPDPCDVEAGDFLDLQGVGVFRPDRDISATRAVQACADAVREDPQNGRFHYQLGKALEQSGRLEEAVKAYTDAARLGHLRADNALGQIAARQPGQEQAGMTYFRRCADQGDPICVQSLGILQLKLADTSAEYDEAYQLLSYAIDFGLPEAMRALADHFDNPATPDHDPERAAVFSREAAAREAEIGRARPQSETSAWITDRINRRNDPGGAEKGTDDNDDNADNDDNSNF